MATIYIDGEAYQVNPDKNLLEVSLSLGLNLPYFCWHPAMGSVGACRQCAVKVYKDENDTKGRLVMACMTAASDGTRLSINDKEAVEFRASVIEWLMVNHPHDCPICDEGGECHLQDMTVMTGHDYRRYRGNKRTYNNQYLGPLVNQEMNRCIQCYRCVRFYREYAGGRDFDSFASRNHVFFGRYEDGVLENEFSGNLVEICPTGVFTDKTLKKHYNRKWDLQTAPSVCVNCGLGCNTTPGERYGGLRRIRNRYNGEVNGYFLCDRGRYGYEFVNSEKRIRMPLIRNGDGTQTVSREEILEHLSGLLADKVGSGKVIGIGSPRASLESNFALRELVGAEHFYAGISAEEHKLIAMALRILRDGPARSPSLHEVALADAVFVLGEDVTNTAPMLALNLRQSVRHQPMEKAWNLRIPVWDDHAIREVVQQDKGPLFVATPGETRLDEIATATYRAAPQDLARLGFAVAHELDEDAPDVSGLPEDVRALAKKIARTLKEAARPLVISGTSLGSQALLQAAANVAWALHPADRPPELCLTVPESNSLGLALMGGGSLQEALQALQSGEVETAIILENDLYRRGESPMVDSLLDSIPHKIVIEHLETPTSSKAEIVLPGATFAEGDGTLVNNEGRAQRFFQIFVPEGEVRESWRWLRDMAVAVGRLEEGAWNILDDVAAALARKMVVFAILPELAPPANFRIAGAKIPRQPHRYSGRTAMRANINVSEPKPPDDPDTPLAFSMEGFKGIPPAALIPRFWAPGWNSIQSLNKFQSEIAGPLQGGDPGKRLIEPGSKGNLDYFQEMPSTFQRRQDEWLLVPFYHIFGSEELSVLTPGLAELAPEPYLAVNAEDAARLQAPQGARLKVSLDGTALNLPFRQVASLPPGVAGLPVGLPGSGLHSLPVWARLEVVEVAEAEG